MKRSKALPIGDGKVAQCSLSNKATSDVIVVLNKMVSLLYIRKRCNRYSIIFPVAELDRRRGHALDVDDLDWNDLNY
jgi:hypothetical protein